MTCEKYEEALIEMAATGEMLEDEFAEHIERCGRCQAALLRERELFEAIDQGLREELNDTPGAGFLAGVRVQISKEPQRNSGWNGVWAWAGLAVALALIAMAHPWRGLRKGAAEGIRTATVIRVERQRQSANSERRASEGPHARDVARQSATIRRVVQRVDRREPEVLVPPDEVKAFAQFVARVRGRDERAEAVVHPMMLYKAGDDGQELLEMHPVDIADLQIESLVWDGGSGRMPEVQDLK
jgi:hypothetical protein